jgi:hypothetical protein
VYKLHGLLFLLFTPLFDTVTSYLEESHSGLVRSLGKRVGCKSPRGFESPLLRNIKLNYMGNNKISITAEFVSIIRSKDDSKNLYFVSPKTQSIYNYIKKLIPESKLKEIFDWRLKLSKIIDEKILITNPEQIIEFGAGYSLQGFNLCTKNSDLVYIDSDFNNVIFQKKKILETICEKESIEFPQNYHLIGIDVLNDDIFEKIKKLISSEKKTLVLAEGLTSYFNDTEFQIFFTKIMNFLSHFSNSEFYSNESISKPNSIIYSLLRLFISLLTRTKGHKKFKSSAEFEEYLRNINISEIKIDSNDQEFLFYSITND